MKSGKIKSTDELTMSVNGWRTGGAPSRTAAMMVPVNTAATVDDLIKGVAVQSGNDAAICLAEALAASRPVAPSVWPRVAPPSHLNLT